jgi:hypothetical protein
MAMVVSTWLLFAERRRAWRGGGVSSVALRQHIYNI